MLPIAAVTAGSRGESLADLPALAEAGAIAFSDDGNPVPDPDILSRALQWSRTLGLPIMDHCEDLSLSGDGVMNEGPIAARLGLKGIPREAEDRMTARDIALARETGGRLHIAHVSTARSAGLIADAKRRGLAVTAEVTPPIT